MVHVGDERGGSQAVVGLIEKFGDALEVDLQRFYQVDLRDMFRDNADLTPRRVLALAHAAAKWEPTSLLRAGILGNEWHGWGRTERVIADLFDAQWAIAYGRAGAKTDPPTYRRPNSKSPAAPSAGRVISVSQIAAATGRGT